MQTQDRVLSIKDLNRYMKTKLESDDQLQNIWIRGEISNFTHHSSGHMYFTLKDADSRIKCIMFASYNQRLPFRPKEGSRVMARGSISVYERDGQYQFYIVQMQPDGIGTLYLAYEELKRRLDAEGLFAAERKKPLPRYPHTIGVVTSPTGAAVRDIVTTLTRRYPAASILLFPVLVQGTQAAPSIAAAIDRMNELALVDVLIVGRGGGSLEELWAFNEEIVARSIYRSLIPVISAVGHETDFTIADFVADVRAATPTAAAELAVPHYLELKQQLRSLSQRMERGLARQVQQSRERLLRIRRSPVLQQPRRQLLQPAERLDRLVEQLQSRTRKQLTGARERMLRLDRSLAAHNPLAQAQSAKRRGEAARHQLILSMQGIYKENRNAFLAGIRHLDALSPLKIMQRGYSLVYDEQEKRLVKSVAQVQPGDIVKIRLNDGRLDCQVWSMEGDGGNGRNEG